MHYFGFIGGRIVRNVEKNTMRMTFKSTKGQFYVNITFLKPKRSVEVIQTRVKSFTQNRMSQMKGNTLS